MARVQSRLGADTPLSVLEQNLMDFTALLLSLPFLLLLAVHLLDALLFQGARSSLRHAHPWCQCGGIRSAAGGVHA